jgi:hypothetical protein
MASARLERLKAKWAAHEAAVQAHQALEQQIKDAITYGSTHVVYGTRRWRKHGDEPVRDSLAREVRVRHCPDFNPSWVWGREYWETRRDDSHHPIIAWTEDKNGRIVRAWRRHLTASELRAYDTPGDRSCPIEAAWLPSVAPGLLSFPALPFVALMDGNKDPRVLETVRNLCAIRPVEVLA